MEEQMQEGQGSVHPAVNGSLSALRAAPLSGVQESQGSATPARLAAPRLVGYMYVAKRPCGRWSAMCWDDPKYAKDTAKSVASFIKRGDMVERVARYEGEPMPEPMCNECRGKPCQNIARATGASND